MAVNALGTSGNSAATAQAQTTGTVDKRIVASEKLAEGNRELTGLGAVLVKLRAALKRLSETQVQYSRRVEDRKVTVRSQELGLNYDAGDNDLTKLLGEVGALAGVSAGTFSVNGVSLSVDPSADSLTAVLARIQASPAGVAASIDTGADRLELASTASRRPLALSDGTSGLFSSLKVSPRQYAPSARRTPSFGEPRKLRELLRDVGDALGELFDGEFKALDKDLLDKARASVREAIESAVKSATGATGDVLRTGMGLEFDFRGEMRPAGRKALTTDARAFSAALEKDFAGVQKLLLGSTGEEASKGLAPALLTAVEDLMGTLMGDLGTKLADGVMVDLKA